nr:PREDICTED: uncharacterized protein LOC102349206 [Latimeria chalumnae]|eukprot:XP_014349217.1 PREDICTED: uncharacterized protein LOC102349206 [Latimeria chalumnae]
MLDSLGVKCALEKEKIHSCMKYSGTSPTGNWQMRFLKVADCVSKTWFEEDVSPCVAPAAAIQFPSQLCMGKSQGVSPFTQHVESFSPASLDPMETSAPTPSSSNGTHLTAKSFTPVSENTTTETSELALPSSGDGERLDGVCTNLSGVAAVTCRLLRNGTLQKAVVDCLNFSKDGFVMPCTDYLLRWNFCLEAAGDLSDLLPAEMFCPMWEMEEDFQMVKYITVHGFPASLKVISLLCLRSMWEQQLTGLPSSEFQMLCRSLFQMEVTERWALLETRACSRSLSCRILRDFGELVFQLDCVKKLLHTLTCSNLFDALRSCVPLIFHQVNVVMECADNVVGVLEEYGKLMTGD